MIPIIVGHRVCNGKPKMSSSSAFPSTCYYCHRKPPSQPVFFPPMKVSRDEDTRIKLRKTCAMMKMLEECRLSTSGFEGLPQSVQFALLAVGVFLFFGVHNLLQEAIMSVPDFKYGVMLGYMEVLGVAVCSFIEREFVARERGRVAPMSAYPLLTGCLLASSALSNISLNYINFPTKVVFRSCKLIPTMLVASVVHKKVFTSVEYSCAIAICTGLVFFAAADWELTPSFNPIGLALVSLSVCADAILPNAQERLFRIGSTRLEVTLYTNIFTLIVMTITTLLSGDFMGALRQTMQNPQLQLYFTIYTCVAYMAISMHMIVVKRFGGVAAVLLATGRKGMTLVLSFLLFPKAFSWYYPIGAVLVLGGLLFSSLHKIHSRRNNGSNNFSHEERAALKSHASDIEVPDTPGSKDGNV